MKKMVCGIVLTFFSLFVLLAAASDTQEKDPIASCNLYYVIWLADNMLEDGGIANNIDTMHTLCRQMQIVPSMDYSFFSVPEGYVFRIAAHFGNTATMVLETEAISSSDFQMLESECLEGGKADSGSVSSVTNDSILLLIGELRTTSITVTCYSPDPGNKLLYDIPLNMYFDQLLPIPENATILTWNN